jgi:hypothetical protein
VKQINGVAPQIFSEYGEVNLDDILDLHAYDGTSDLPRKFPQDSQPHLVNQGFVRNSKVML